MTSSPINVAAFHAWHGVSIILVVRSLPVFVFLLVTSRTSLWQKLVVLTTALLLGAVTRGWTLIPWSWFALSYLYWLTACALVPSATRRSQEGRLSRVGAFMLCLGGFLVLPGLLWPPEMKLVALVFGWDLALSSYSYCVETARSREPPSRADCLFFLLVNPALVYSQRGTRTGPPSFERTGIQRIVLALALFFATSLLLMPLDQIVRQRASSVLPSRFSLGDLFMGGLVGFAIQYAQASALASLQIGLLRQTGHQIPERYDWPIRAKSLPDFWRRWNTYVSQWTLHYLFWPLSIALGRRFRDRRSRMFVTAAALVVAFVAVGFLHDTYASLFALAREFRLTVLFLANGILVVLWLGLERIGQTIHERGRVPEWCVPAASIVSRVYLWCFVTTFAAVWWLKI